MIFIVDPLKPSKGFLGGLIVNMVYFIKSVTPNVSQFVNFLKNDSRIVSSEKKLGKISDYWYFHIFLKKQEIKVISGKIIIQKLFHLQDHQKQYILEKKIKSKSYFCKIICSIAYQRFFTNFAVEPHGGTAQNMSVFLKNDPY